MLRPKPNMTKKTKKKVNNRKAGTGCRASIQPMSASKTGIAASRGMRESFLAIDAGPLFAHPGRDVPISCFLAR